MQDEQLYAYGSSSSIRQKWHHGSKLTFTDSTGREDRWKEDDKNGEVLLACPENIPVAHGNVFIAGTPKNSGPLRILDTNRAPALPVLIAAYVELLRLQSLELIDRARNKNAETFDLAGQLIDTVLSIDGGGGGGHHSALCPNP